MVASRYEAFAEAGSQPSSLTHSFVERRTPVGCGARPVGLEGLETDKIQQHWFTFRATLIVVLGNQLAADRACRELLLRGFKDSYDMANTYPQFLCQCGLHGNLSAGLGFGSGLPVSLLAQASPALEYLHLAPSFGGCRRVGQRGNTNYVCPLSAISSRSCFEGSGRLLRQSSLDLTHSHRIFGIVRGNHSKVSRHSRVDKVNRVF